MGTPAESVRVPNWLCAPCTVSCSRNPPRNIGDRVQRHLRLVTQCKNREQASRLLCGKRLEICSTFSMQLGSILHRSHAPLVIRLRAHQAPCLLSSLSVDPSWQLHTDPQGLQGSWQSLAMVTMTLCWAARLHAAHRLGTIKVHVAEIPEAGSTPFKGLPISKDHLQSRGAI